ncbi:hypothetical protein [Methylosinus sp. Ce-a6]|uniref:hypothetical protein n=1 Tax=Methylosinus sp. Ce-a6 TaxID=2172005 RepID=UPI00135AB134|nr:hypothetical protein [Methylosinus sp. Ce-a6]
MPAALRGYIAELELQARLMSERAAVLSSKFHEAQEALDAATLALAVARDEIAKLKVEKQ